MTDRSFVCYSERYVFLGGTIEGGCLRMESDIAGDDQYPDSEKIYSFSKEETEKLFSIISVDDFVKLCREKHLMGMEEFLEENDITYSSFCF